MLLRDSVPMYMPSNHIPWQTGWVISSLYSKVLRKLTTFLGQLCAGCRRPYGPPLLALRRRTCVTLICSCAPRAAPASWAP